MKTFLQPLQNLAEMEEIQKQAKKNRGILEISGCMESQKAHLKIGRASCRERVSSPV